MSPSAEGEEEWEEPSPPPPPPPFPPPPPWLLPPPPPMSPPPDPARACGVAIGRAGLWRGREVGQWRKREGGGRGRGGEPSNEKAVGRRGRFFAASRLRIPEPIPLPVSISREQENTHLFLVEGATERAGRRAGAREEGLMLLGFFIAIAVGGICDALLGCAAARGCIAIGIRQQECALRDRLISRGAIRRQGMEQRRTKRGSETTRGRLERKLLQ